MHLMNEESIVIAILFMLTCEFFIQHLITLQDMEI